MSYAIYLLKSKRQELKKVIRDYQKAVDNGEILNHVLTVGAYEKHIEELNKAIEKLEG